ncbi:MAG TPA: asparagine synthase-related protein, partial [Nitrospira sp.]|nr:asparagine synthase-related protein [Nitrospira sp.]
VESIRNLRLLTFFGSLYRWGIARRKSIFQLLRETIQLLRAPASQKLLSAYDGSSLVWALVRPPDPGQALGHFARWKELSPWALCADRIRFALAQQLSNTEPPLVGCNERRYPYLDRPLFVFLASIPRTQILQPGKRRFLMRRAMRGIVPDSVLYRRTKWFGYRRPMVALRQEHAALRKLFDEPWLSDGVVIDASLIREHLELALHGSTDDALALISAVGIEQWMRSLVRHVSVALPGALQMQPDLTRSALAQREVTLTERR